MRDRHEGAMARSCVAGVLLVAVLALLMHAERHDVPEDRYPLRGYGLAGAACMTGFAVLTGAGLRWR